MNTVLRLALLVTCGFVASLQAGTNLLPGLTFYPPKQALGGKLVFLLHHNAEGNTNSPTAGVIYEFDLAQSQLQKVTDSPAGLLVPARDGASVCVVYRPGDYFRSETTNVFVFSRAMAKGATISLSSPPKTAVLLADHAFFEVEHAKHTRIHRYAVTTGHSSLIAFPNASQWEYQVYDRIHAPQGSTNVLHFKYRAFGEQLGDGVTHRRGYYSYDIDTSEIQRLDEDYDDQSFFYRTWDGRYVFFEGRDIPVHGFKLVSAPWNHREHERNQRDAPTKVVRTLTTFSRLPALTGGGYTLLQISPCGRYAVVQLTESTAKKTGMLPGTVETYYIVNVDTGVKHVLLKDRVQKETKGYLSQIWWVSSWPKPE